MDYYEKKIKAYEEINKWLGSCDFEKKEEVKKTYEQLRLYILLSFGFSESFIQKYFKLRHIKILDGVVEIE